MTQKPIAEIIESEAEAYVQKPMPETLKQTLIEYKPDNVKIVQRMEYAAHKAGANKMLEVLAGRAPEFDKKAILDLTAFYNFDTRESFFQGARYQHSLDAKIIQSQRETLAELVNKMPHGVYCGDKNETRYPCLKCVETEKLTKVLA